VSTGTITWGFNAGGDELTTDSVVEVFDANGNLITTFCARTTGTRFE
jgi:hypothetical protein